jgi:hypothetical protein
VTTLEVARRRPLAGTDHHQHLGPFGRVRRNHVTDVHIPADVPTAASEAPQAAQKAPATRVAGVEEALAPPAGKSDTAARRRAGNSNGGKAKRAVALIGLGLPPERMPILDLRTHEARLSLLEAIAQAVALGKTSGLVAQTLVTVVREARAESNAELERLVQAQAQRIHELEAGTVVSVRGGRR